MVSEVKQTFKSNKSYQISLLNPNMLFSDQAIAHFLQNSTNPLSQITIKSPFISILNEKINEHFEQLIAAKIEYLYCVENYCLSRAVDALYKMNRYATTSKRDKFLYFFGCYLSAMYGKSEICTKEIEKFTQTGDIGLLQKFNQCMALGGLGYEWHRKEHQRLKQITIFLATICQAHVKNIFDKAEKKHLIWKNEIIEGFLCTRQKKLD